MYSSEPTVTSRFDATAQGLPCVGAVPFRRRQLVLSRDDAASDDDDVGTAHLDGVGRRRVLLALVVAVGWQADARSELDPAGMVVLRQRRLTNETGNRAGVIRHPLGRLCHKEKIIRQD